MMTNTRKIFDRMRRLNANSSDCAAALHIKTPTYTRKINNISHFTLAEAQTLQVFLNIPDAEFADYFFNS